MRNCIYKLLCWIVLLTLCLPMAVNASAVSIDTEKDASLTLIYKYDEKLYEGLEVRSYRVADIGDDFAFTLAGQFVNYPVELYNITSQAEWNVICQTLKSYVVADRLVPTATAVTNAEGAVKFDNLKPGLYLTMPVSHLSEEAITEFFAFLTVVPNPAEDGTLNYDVTAYPKSTQYDPSDGDTRILKVIKQWKDSGFEEKRPESVKVDIFRDGEFLTTVKLSPDNNWTHSWVAPDDGAVWTAVEREIPSQYTVTIEEKYDTIIITNVCKGEDGPPDSGDTTVLWPYILGMCLSGFVFIFLAMGKKKAAA